MKQDEIDWEVLANMQQYAPGCGDEAQLYNDALVMLQEAELLSKSVDYNDIIDCSGLLEATAQTLNLITSFSTTALRHRMQKIEERINMI